MFRIILLAAMGLGAMYMMHLLAQDFNRIRRPIQNAVRSILYKRDLQAVQQLQQHPQLLRHHHEPVTFDGAEVNWNRILQNDPLNCALLLICELASGSEEQNREAGNINAYVQYSIEMHIAPPKIVTAYQRGRNKRATDEHCYKEYPHCPYAAKTMLNILDIHAYLFQSDGQQPDKVTKGAK